VCLELRNAHSWQTIDIDSSVGEDDVGWLWADGCGGLLARSEFEIGRGRLGSTTTEGEGWSEVETTVSCDRLDHGKGCDKSD